MRPLTPISRRRRVLPLRLNTCEPRDLPSSSIPLSLSNWTSLGPAPLLGAQTPGSLPASGRASSVAVHPTDSNTIYVGTAGGGVWKTTNGNDANPTWTPLTDNQASCFIGCVTLAPSNPNIVYVGTGESELRDISFYGRGVLKSTDAGATWSLQGSDEFDRTVISNIVVHPTNPDIVFAAVAGFGSDGDPTKVPGVYRSMDGGLTWVNTTAASIPGAAGFSDVEVDPSNPNVMWAGAGVRLGHATDGVYRSTNALAASPTWTLVSNLPSGATVGRTELAIAPSNNQVVYVSMQSVATEMLVGWFQTTNGGTNWTDRTSAVPATDRLWFCHNLLVDPGNPDIVYWSGTTNLIRSTNGGANWTPINSGTDGKGPHVDHHGFALDSVGRFIAVGDGGIYRYTVSTNLWVSLNGVNTSRNQSGALNTIQFMGIAISPTDPNFIIGGTQDNGTELFSDSLGWTLNEGGDGGDVIIDPFNPQRMWRANPVRSFGAGAFVRRSTNGGSSWSSIVNGITDALNTTAFYPPMAADPGTVNRIFLGAKFLYVSTNAGTNWGRLPGDTTTFTNEIRSIGIGPASAGTIYVGTGPAGPGTVTAAAATQVFVTTNNGVTWTERTPQFDGGFEAFAVDPTDSNIAYVVSSNFSPTGDNIWKTTNAGETWVSISGNLPEVPFYDVLLDPGATSANTDDILYVGGDQGVFRSTDLGATWTRFGAGLPIAQVRDLEYSPQTKILAAATHGRGVWEILTGIPNIPGQIAGIVYDDTNANGKLDGAEPGLQNWVVWRDDNNNGVVDSFGTSTFSGPSTPLPDLATTTAKLTISGLTGVVTDLDMKFNITHTFDGDLQAFLTSPAGTKITLFSGVGGAGQNFTNTVLDDEAAVLITAGVAPFTGSFQPQGLMSNFDGQSPNGTWTLTITDVGPSDTGTLNSWSLTVATGENVTTTLPDGSYALQNNLPGTYNIRRVLQNGWVATEPPGGVQVVMVPPAAGVIDVNFGQTQNPPAKVAATLINNGAVQRSRVTQVQVTFDQIVTLPGTPANAFQLFRQSDAAPVSLAAAVDNSGPGTVVTLTFTGGAVDADSLADGRYTLTVLAGLVDGGLFDGDGNGLAGDNYVLASAAGPSPPTNLWRLFGDSDGDNDVDTTDFVGLRGVFGGSGNTFDFDNDGNVDTTDYAAFRMRFGGSV